MSTVKPIPEGYHTVTPYFTVPDAARFMEYLKRAFHAEQRFLSRRSDGTVGHAEMQIGTSIVMLGQASDQWKARPCSIYLYVEDVDAVYHRATEAGGKSMMEPADQFYGDRIASVEDTEGNYWYISTHIEDLSAEEIERRAKAAGR